MLYFIKAKNKVKKTKIGLKLTWTPSARSDEHFLIFLEVPEPIYSPKITAKVQ